MFARTMTTKRCHVVTHELMNMTCRYADTNNDDGDDDTDGNDNDDDDTIHRFDAVTLLFCFDRFLRLAYRRCCCPRFALVNVGILIPFVCVRVYSCYVLVDASYTYLPVSTGFC